MHKYDHHIGDYIRDTVGLSMVEDGAYRRLMDQSYASELPLPAEKSEIYRMTRAMTPAERKAVDYILGKYFVLLADGWHQNRVDREIAEFHGKSTQASAAAALRWERERMRKRSADAHATASPTADASAHADASISHPFRNASRAGADAGDRPPSSVLRPPSSELQNRDSGVHQPYTPQGQGVDPPKVNGAVSKIGTSKAKTEGAGQQWGSMAYVAATAKTIGKPRRENESDDEWKDRVYAEVQARRAGAAH